jgi:hypothetical protein
MTAITMSTQACFAATVALLLWRSLKVASFSTPQHARSTLYTYKSTTLVSSHSTRKLALFSARKKDNKEDDETDNQLGMADAFRQLDSLKSLGETLGKPSKPQFKSLSIETPAVDPPAIEQQVQVYTELVNELETTPPESVYTDLIQDLGGQPQVSSIVDTKPPGDLLDQALKEALEQVQLQNPSMKKSILDDKDIMAEIEAVLEAGNKKLMDSLEEIRKEQVRTDTMKVVNLYLMCIQWRVACTCTSVTSECTPMRGTCITQTTEYSYAGTMLLLLMHDTNTLFCVDPSFSRLFSSCSSQLDLARQSAQKDDQNRRALTVAEQARLQQAEANLQKVLSKVQAETANVQQAVQELQAAQESINNDPLQKLRQGGIIKQGALAGFLLFTLRSIVDSVSGISSSNPDLIMTGLIQGGIALLCAAILFLVK